MLTIYIITGIIGLGLIIASAVGGFGSDADVDVSSDVDVSHDMSHHHDLDSAGDIWLPFLSLRFWTYLLGGFGGFGLLLSLIGVNQEPLRLISSVVVGLLSGFAAAYTMRYFQRNNINSSISDEDFLGAAAMVTVAPNMDNPGKIRVTLKDETIDLLAVPLEGHTIASGDEVVVVSVNGSTVTVANAEKYLNN